MRRVVCLPSSVLLCALAVLWLYGHGASAQQPSGLKPGQVPINDPGDVLTRDIASSRRWTVRAQVRLYGAQPRSRNALNTPETQAIVFDACKFIYPQILETASSVPYPEDARFRLQLNRRAPQDRRVTPDRGWPVNENVLTNVYGVIEGYQGPTDLMVLEVEEVSATSLLLQVQLDVRTWETRIDEARADAIEWPTDPWPPQLVSNLERQLFVEPDHPAIRELLARFLNGKDPRSVRPYALAKHLAARVVEYIEFTDNEYHSVGRGANVASEQTLLVNGFRVHGAVPMAITGQGNRLDAPCLLCALYRAAGLPARLVIGYDALNPNGFDISRLPPIRAWVEFALLDDERDVTEWIPVDISAQRDFSNRAPALDRTWEHFGLNRDLDFVIPISHHWHPPTTATNDGPPAIWGWRPEPVIPEIDSSITFEAFQSSVRGDDAVDPYRR
ncbi:MAG: hypothetical protein Tsb0013_06980 [Phycisphaerales bacterium]